MSIAFILKKIITSFILLPGLLITISSIVALFSGKRLRIYTCILAGAVYILSIEPTSDLILKPLEDAYNLPEFSEVASCDAYVVLGGGIVEGAPDIDGRGSAGTALLPRLVTAYRLYRKYPKPIIISGGSISGGPSEAEIAGKLLISLGVPDEHIVKEPLSADTYENALRTKEAAKKKGARDIILITSAFHIKRAMLIFGRHFTKIVPYPADYRVSRGKYTIISFLPNAEHFYHLAIAAKEYLGIMYYKLIPS